MISLTTDEAEIYSRAEEAAAFVRQRLGAHAEEAGHHSAIPKVAVILGSGLGELADALETPQTIAYSEIPHFPAPSVEGHRGRLVAGRMNGVNLLAMQGRVHGYEGYTPTETTFGMRLLGRLAIEAVIVTNAAGGICEEYAPGDLVAISDHINLTGTNPLVGPNDRRFGERFVDMTDAYSSRLRTLAIRMAAQQGWAMREGVYLGVTGPNFETPAEIRAFRALGADLVGMSTVHEVLAARHMGMEVLGISCVTNMAAGILKTGGPEIGALPAKVNHEDVLKIGRAVAGRLLALLHELLPHL